MSNSTREKEKISDFIKEVTEEILNKKVTGYDNTFVEIGLKSVDIPLFIKKISNEFNINLEVETIFKYPTINRYSELIFNRLNNIIGNSENEKALIVNEKEKVAIVGMSCRFPNGANNPTKYWDIITSGENGIVDMPKDRWDVDKYYSEDKKESGKMYVKKAGFLDIPIKKFDAQFFNISPKEAEAMDPQQRLLLELVWEAFEASGSDIREYYGTNTGVYLAIAGEEYSFAHCRSGNLNKVTEYSLTGCTFSTACGRVAYTFGFEGPCMAIDTACSSALTAVHVACKALESGEVDTAIVAGVNMILTPLIHVCFSKLGAIAPDGQSKAFDASANGFGRGEGLAVIILKRVKDARANKDNILGIVRGTAINQDGKSNGLTAPNGAAQEKVILKALKDANLKATDISYVEMHGTGTALGDPIEVDAITKTYCKNRIIEKPLKIGSVKSNIGHLEATAGLASIIKVLLSFKNELIPGNLHFNNPNPLIDWENSPIKVVDCNTKWERGKKTRRVGINGFGFGGSNAHVILEEPEIVEIEEKSLSDPRYILKISSKTENGLRNNIKNTIDFIEENKELNFRDFIYTNNINKSDFDYRFVISGRDKNEIIGKMEAYVENNVKEDIIVNDDIEASLNNNKKLVFLYTGQGSQYIGMGESLYKNNLAFKDAFNECDKLFEPYISKSLVDLIYSKDFTNKYIERTLYAQPLIFSIEYALSKFWESIGIEPDIVLGHSIGEYAAAVISDVISLNDGVRLVAARCRLMDSAPGEGSMISLYNNLQEVNLLIADYKDRVSVAVHNAKNNIVISGEKKAIEEISMIAENKGIKVKELHVSHAFHSQMMEPILNEFKDIASNIKYRTSKYEFMSTKLARYLEKDEVLDADYWTGHIAEKVDFYNALKSIGKQSNIVFVEVGATNTLCALTRLILGEETVLINSLDIKKDALSVIGNAIGELYCNDFPVNWKKCNFNQKDYYNRVSLPIYQFNKEEYWIEPVYEQENNNCSNNIEYHPLIGERISTPYLKNTLIYQSIFTNESPYFMKEHIIFDTPISPAAAHMTMLLSIAKEYQSPSICTIENVEFHSPLIATEEEEKVVQFIIQDTNLEQMKFEIVSKEKRSRNENWIKHCKGNITLSQENISDKRIVIDELKSMYPEENSGFNMYRVMEKFGFNLGDGFTRIFNTWRKNDEGVCYVEPNNIPELQEYTVYAGTLDSIFQSIFSVSELSREMDNETDKYSMKTTIPISVKKIKYYYRDAKEYWCHVKVDNSQKSGVVGDISVYNEKGQLVFEIEKMMAKLTDRESLLKELNNNGNNLLYNVSWNKENAIDKKIKFTENEVVVVFSDDESIVNRFKSKLLEYDVNTIGVIQGDEYIECDNNLYYLNYKNKKDFEKLLYTISSKFKESNFKLLYISASNETDITYDKLISKEEQECSGLLYLVQLITELNYIQKMKLKVIVNNLHPLENSKISIYQSTLWGFSQVIRLEHTQLWDGIIDVDYDMLINNVDSIIKEVKNSKDKQVVIRNNNRYVPRLVKSKKNIEECEITIDKNASYLITGGTGNIGQVYAEYLADKGAKNIILLSRREPNEEVLKKINLLNDNGINVYVENIDVSNRDEILSFVNKLKNNSIEIKGVIHTAGVLEDRMIRDQDWNSFEKLFMAKVWGTYNLHEALINESLDFFIMTSSITAIAGNIGQANYAAANYFMNVFAEYRRSLGMPAIAVCWGAWADGGMVTQVNDSMKNIYAKGLYSISKELGRKMIDKIFNKDIASIIVADANWRIFAEKTGVDEVTEFLSTIIEEKDLTNNNKSAIKEDLLFKLRSLDKENRNEYLLKKLQQITAEIMGFNNINNLSLDKTFTEQGADSLIIFSIRNEIKKLLNEEIDISVFFNYPSLRKLSEYLLEEIIVFDSVEQKEVINEKQIESETVEDILLEITSLIK